MYIFTLLIFSSICYINVNADLQTQLLQFVSAVISRTLKCQISRNLNLDVSEIDVYFYDFKNHVYRSFPIDKAAQGILSINNLNKANKFFMYVGGFRSHIKKTSTERIRDAFRGIDNSYLIIVDHSAYTHDRDGYTTSYKRSVKYVANIGQKLAEMLAGLKAGGVSPKNIHCIGHSLGGQMLKYVGEKFIELTGQKISRITALDPAGPCFFGKSNQEHVRSGDADYVEIYHCNAGIFGSDKSLGDINFFANGGKTQPICEQSTDSSIPFVKTAEASKCSHKMCTRMWAASVRNQDWFPAYKSENYKYFKLGRYSQNEVTTAGFWDPGTTTGKYYFSTKGYDFN